MKDILQSTAALLAALAALIGAVVSFMKLFPRSAGANRSEKVKSKQPSGKLSSFARLFKKPAFVIGLLLLLIGAGIFVARALIPPPPLSEQLTTEAWDLFNDHEYEAAIKRADECIGEFEGEALRHQQTLTASEVPFPSIGGVSEEEKRVIFSRGVLNDVATCYLIKGRALEALKRYSEAKQMYAAAARFPHARTWDTRRWVWSPAADATDRAARLP